MTSSSFNHGWTVGPKTSIYAALQGASSDATEVTLPHDAQFALERSPSAGEGPHNGYFPSGAFTYAKRFDVPESYRTKRVSIEFQGAYRDAVVFVNDVFAAQRPNGYSTFTVDLDPFLRYGETNTVTVDVRAHEDSRWYTGSGLHRDVVLHVRELVHLVPNGVRVTTPDVDEERAVVEVATDVRNASLSTSTLALRTGLRAPGGADVAVDVAPVTLRAGEVVTVRQRLYVDSPVRWDVEDPALYTVTSALEDVLDVVDTAETRFGIRTLQLDPRRGLRLNGRTVKLRGACIHHDNGLLGAAAVGAAEERRVRILKEAGFNAVRSSHNPISQAMLDACDRLGMLVVDELTDVWTVSKSSHDYSLAFPEWWERDVEAMVAKDYNHPSVIMYSIGNENPENGDGLAGQWGRALAEKVRALDETRYVTNGVNGFVAALAEVAEMMQAHAAAAAAAEDQGVNGAMNAGDFMNQVSASPQVTAKTAEAFSVLDVAGMNYGDARYAMDRDLYPNRIILGTETFPSHIAVNWGLVEEFDHVLGDFTWTGWDYLGEAGAGRITYLEDGEQPTFEAGFPWLTAWTGDVDVTGHRRPVSYYRETVFGLRDEPYIAVQRPENHGRPSFAGQWAWSDTVGGWSWPDAVGKETTVEVYSTAEEVELELNGRSLGRRPAGRAHAFLATFEVVVEPGTLVAIARDAGSERGRTVLRSATGDTVLTAWAEDTRIGTDSAALAFVPIELRDAAGSLVHAADRRVHVLVEGPANLVAVGSGRPDQRERFDSGTSETYDGRALAIVRPTGPGTITVTVAAEGLAPVTVTVRVEAEERSTDAPGATAGSSRPAPMPTATTPA
ncbi:glycoside hydrolase family 2 TIM barrel-domain containing protein [Curtobacterium sp. BRB10]|uniref:glycoside hydrolase family 2 TIM barrel-domain containing protein n=1 Tax=Curtobacterium sp. BRB10 TaxID=2962579 RepID=UPI0028816903|nr:glycoside hydrolase family 2 TIM barrel-domain containing protein [Curtobacterium sp. BRB10]MDT0234844.1 glycoside hydrolase family 2 TIM barrel-domain containing protein [Curtobacterium sp. BRB10]